MVVITTYETAADKDSGDPPSGGNDYTEFGPVTAPIPGGGGIG